MKTVLLSLSLVLFFHYSQANNLHDQLCHFNPNWEQYETSIQDTPSVEILSEAHYVQVHLSEVIPILHAQTKECPDHLKATRNELINVLTDYKNAGVFPINYHVNERIPVFIDEHNTHCAVGYLMRYSGHADLALSISKWNNYVWVKQLDWAEVVSWQQNSGFTLEELKLIQGAYDNYRFDALYLPNKHEVPQKPEVMTITFDNSEDIWLSGEGEGKVLHGAWIQNYAAGVSWIRGFYNHGKRTGRWEEYYPGTELLQRTEYWRNDELNGVRTRYDREGNIVEELLFVDGAVQTKTNYDFQGDLKWVRTPIDSVYMNTKVYTLEGGLLAEGMESVYNPGNLEWFQNIELTALNMASITARDDSPETALSIRKPGRFHFLTDQPQTADFFNTRPLVQYHKEGEWTFYSESIHQSTLVKTIWGVLEMNYPHMAAEMNMKHIEECEITSEYTAIKAVYKSDELQEFKGHFRDNVDYFSLSYYEGNQQTLLSMNTHLFNDGNNYGHFLNPANNILQLQSVGKLNSNGQRIGKWKHFNTRGTLYKIEEFILPEEVMVPQGEGVSENN